MLDCFFQNQIPKKGAIQYNRAMNGNLSVKAQCWQKDKKTWNTSGDKKDVIHPTILALQQVY